VPGNKKGFTCPARTDHHPNQPAVPFMDLRSALDIRLRPSEIQFPFLLYKNVPDRHRISNTIIIQKIDKILYYVFSIQEIRLVLYHTWRVFPDVADILT
jgi:hypothetical protein